MKSLLRIALLLVLVPVLGCPAAPSSTSSVTVYCAADREFADGLFAQFEKETGIHVDAKYDTEATKTLGLAQAISAERARPRCDVFWDNELLQTLLLEKQGDVGPAKNFAGRARVLLVNTAVVSTADAPTSYRDLANPRWKGRAGIANPLFGTTADHVAALFAKLGEKEATAVLESWKQNDVQVCSGNADVKNRVCSGELAFGFTDTDDAHEAVADGKPVKIVFADQGASDVGTLVMPNALAVVTNAPHPAAAAKLIAWLASEKGEAALATGPGVHLPLLGGGPRPEIFPKDLKAMDVKWDEVAKVAPAAREAVQKVLLATK